MSLIFQNSTLKITGFSPEAYLDELIASEFNPKNIRRIRGTVYLDIQKKRIKSAIKVAEKHQVTVIRHKTAPEPIIKRKLGIIIGGVFFVAINLAFSGNIWKITVSGNEKYTSRQITAILAENSIAEQRVKPTPEAVRIAEQALEKAYENIDAATIEYEGNRLFVNISEIKGYKKVPQNTACNVVAARSGVILNIKNIGGKVIVAKGSGIAEGDLLVSGYYVRNGRNVSENADAEILARCTEIKEFFVPYKKEIYIENGGEETKKSLTLLGWSLPLYFGDNTPPSARCTQLTKRVELGIGAIKIPTPIIQTEKKYTILEKTVTYYTYEDAQKIIEKSVLNYKANFLSDCKIIDETYEVDASELGLKRTVTFTFETDIAKQVI
jgi:sporulation protein YqfD